MSTVAAEPDAGRLRALLLLLCGALGLVVAGNSALAIALPDIARDRAATQGELTWVIDAYALTFAALLLPAGIAADRFGRRSTLVVGLVVFGVAGASSGSATDPTCLIALRALAGVGAAAVFPVTLSALVDAYPDGGAASPSPSGPASARAPSSSSTECPLRPRSVASAVNDLVREVGGVLGIAVLSSALIGSYRADIAAALDGPPVDLAAPVDDGAGSAVAVAVAGLLGPAGSSLADAARDAFTDGLVTSLWLGAAVLTAAALICLRLVPRQPQDRPPHRTSET